MAEIYKIGSDDIVDRVSTFGGTNLALATATSKTCTKGNTVSYFSPIGLWSVSTNGRNKLTDTSNLYFVISFDWNATNVTTAFSMTCTLKYSSTSYSDSGATVIKTTGNAVSTGSSSGHFVKVFTPSDAQRTYGTQFLLGGAATADSTVNIVVSNFKFEKGNKSTDWTPAPEDLVTISGTELQFF